MGGHRFVLYGWPSFHKEKGRRAKLRLKGRTSHGGGPAATAIARRNVRPPIYASRMKKLQQELPFRQWGGARRGAGRKRTSARENVPHRVRRQFRKGALHD